MSDSSALQTPAGELPEQKCYLGCYQPGITGVFHTTGVRLLLFLPFAVAVSISAADILAIVILVCWLLGGHWKERWAAVRNSPVLLAALPFIILTFAGIFRSPASLPDSFRYWNGHYPLFYVIVFATLLDRKSYRYALLSSINLAFLLTWCCAVYLAVQYADADKLVFREVRVRSFQLYRNTICFGMALNLWILLWIYLPYTSRHIPFIRRRLPHFFSDAMETAGKVSPIQLIFSLFPGRNSAVRLNNAEIILSLLRWGIVAFTTYYLFFINSSRTAQLSLLFVYTASLLLKAGRRGLAVAAVLTVLLVGVSYEYSSIFQKKINICIRETQMFYDLVTGKTDEKKYAKTEYMRLGTYYFLIPAVLEKPVFGYGMEEGQILVKQRTKYVDPHSEFLLITLQHGFAGLAVFLFWLLVFTRNVFRMNSPRKSLGICLLTVLCIDCFFNCALSYHREAFFFCFLIGILFLPEHFTAASSVVTASSPKNKQD